MKRNFLFRGMFNSRGYFSVENVSPDEYRAGNFAGPDRQPLRLYLGSSVLFAVGPNGEESLTPDGRERIDRAMATFLRANLPTGARGVIVTSVDPNSDAGDKGFRRGDLIVSVNNQQVTSPAQVIAIVDAARKAGRTSVLLLVKRGNSPEAFVAVDVSGK